MKIDKNERIFQVFLGNRVVSAFKKRSLNAYYDAWDISISGDIHVDYPKLTLQEAKEVKAFLASHAEIRTKIGDANVQVEINGGDKLERI